MMEYEPWQEIACVRIAIFCLPRLVDDPSAEIEGGHSRGTLPDP